MEFRAKCFLFPGKRKLDKLKDKKNNMQDLPFFLSTKETKVHLAEKKNLDNEMSVKYSFVFAKKRQDALIICKNFFTLFETFNGEL